MRLRFRRCVRRAKRIVQLSCEQADTLIAGARAKAKAIGIAVSVAILDSAGHMKAFSRMDGAWLGSSDVALRKARTSILFEAETHDAQAHGLEHTNGGLVTFAGGIPLRAPNGDLLGAIGVSGGQVEQDFLVATAGATSLPG
jgi:uncharacterized protein GlcG (DUF336 family)